MIEEKLQSGDDFWNVQAQEIHTRDGYRREIDQLQRKINLCRRTLSLRAQSGFKEFLDDIDSLRQVELNKLIGCYSSNENMRIIQGRAQALSDILSLLKDTEKTVEGLEARLSSVQNAMAAAITTDGKVLTRTIGASS